MPAFSDDDILQEADRAVNSGRWQAAFDSYRKLINGPAPHPKALLGAGVCCLELGLPEQATEILLRAQETSPDDQHIKRLLAEAFRRLGGQQRSAQDLSAARESLERAYQIAPTDLAVLNDMAVILRAHGDLAGAETLYRAAIDLNPGQALLHSNLGNLLEIAGRLRLAQAELEKAYDLDPDLGDVATNLAALLTKRHRPQDALPLLERKAQSDPGRWDVLTNLGVTRLHTGDVHGAESALRDSLRLNPQNPEAHYNLAWVLLLTGRYAEGWAEYEWRWKMEHFSSEQRAFTTPLWDGSPLDGALLIHAEQGLGDAIQFLRFARRCKSASRKVIVEVPRPLLRLVGTFDPEIDVIARGDPLPSVDAHAPMMSLPHLLGATGSTIPEPEGYLSAPASIEARLTLPETGKKRIGFVWAGSRANKMDGIRSMAASLLAPLAQRDDVFPVNLQVGGQDTDWCDVIGQHQGFDASGLVDDFLDTASIVQQLDAVVGVDTAVIHLAGALGCRCFVLVPFMPDYRWMLERSDTPWYNSVTVVRQSEPKNWTDVVERTAVMLTDL